MISKMMVLILLVSLSLNMCGCAALLVAGGAAAGGAGTATWLSGKLVQVVNSPFEQTIQAARSALESLGLGISSEIKKEKIAQIKSSYIDGETIWIDIHRISQSSSRVAVRVGAISDKEAAVDILDNIKKFL